MKKLLVVLINLLLVGALVMSVAAEESGDATGNAYGPGIGGSTTVSTDIKVDDLLTNIDTEGKENVTVENYNIYVGEPTVDANNSEATITMDINMVVEYTYTDENQAESWGYDSVTGTIPEVTLTIYLADNAKAQLPAEKEGYTRTWKVTAKHEDGTTDVWDADVDVNTGKITFKANKFSTFVLSYTDTKNEEKTEEKTEDKTSEETKTDTSTTTSKTTSDNTYRVVNTAGK